MTDRIAGLSIQPRPHHALVVLVREDGVWRVESATTEVGDVVVAFANPGCPVIVDAAAFWQHSEHSRLGAPDAEQLLAAGWDVRAPVMKGDKPKNPARATMQAHLDEMMDSGRLKASLMLGEGMVEALHLAAWGTREPAADGEQATLAADRALQPWSEAADRVLATSDGWPASIPWPSNPESMTPAEVVLLQLFRTAGQASGEQAGALQHAAEYLIGRGLIPEPTDEKLHRRVSGPIRPVVAGLLPHQRAVAEQLAAWLETDALIAIVIGDRRSGKAYTVNAWAKATGLRVEEVRPSYANSEEGLDECKQAPRDLTVFFEAEKIPRQMVVDALHAGRVVLVAKTPPTYPAGVDPGGWLHDLIEGIREGRLAGVVIECKAPPREVPPAVMKLLRVIGPAGAA